MQWKCGKIGVPAMKFPMLEDACRRMAGTIAFVTNGNLPDYSINLSPDKKLPAALLGGGRGGRKPVRFRT